MYKIESFTSKDPKFKQFIAFQEQLYAGDPDFTTEKSFPYDAVDTQYYLVEKNKDIIGRAAAIVNRDLQYKDYTVGLIGFYECLENADASKELFKTVEKGLRKRGCTYCFGPLNGSTWYKYRVTVPDSSPPFFLDNYHKPWYAQQFEMSGYDTVATYNSSEVTSLSVSPDRVSHFETLFTKKGITIRPVNLSSFEEDVRKIYTICIEAFKENFLYTPISFQEVMIMYKAIKEVINPEYVLLCEDSDGKPLAFIFCVDDLYDKSGKTLVIKTVAVSPGSRSRGLGAFLVEKIHLTAFSKGYNRIIHALMHADNISNKIASKNSTVFRNYRLYGKEL